MCVCVCVCVCVAWRALGLLLLSLYAQVQTLGILLYPRPLPPPYVDTCACTLSTHVAKNKKNGLLITILRCPLGCKKQKIDHLQCPQRARSTLVFLKLIIIVCAHSEEHVYEFEAFVGPIIIIIFLNLALVLGCKK